MKRLPPLTPTDVDEFGARVTEFLARVRETVAMAERHEELYQRITEVIERILPGAMPRRVERIVEDDVEVLAFIRHAGAPVPMTDLMSAFEQRRKPMWLRLKRMCDQHLVMATGHGRALRYSIPGAPVAASPVPGSQVDRDRRDERLPPPPGWPLSLVLDQDDLKVMRKVERVYGRLPSPAEIIALDPDEFVSHEGVGRRYRRLLVDLGVHLRDSLRTEPEAPSPP